MRLLICALVLLGSSFLSFAAKLPPLTTKEISLMLRTGYSVDAVQRELAARHFIEQIDAAEEKTLVQAGATAAFIAALKSGAFAVPASELAAAKEEIAAQAARRARQAEEARKFNTLYQQQQLDQARVAATPAPSSSSHAIAALVKGDLVASRNGVLSSVTDQPIEQKKLIALYFSAKWCGPCRKFTPQLVQYYNRIAAAHPEFEIVFVSADRSGAAMEAYMRDFQMPWPAVKFEKVAEKQELKKYAGSGIPCLVLIDATGKVISDSYQGATYLGPDKVLADLDRLFSPAAAAPVALRR